MIATLLTPRVYGDEAEDLEALIAFYNATEGSEWSHNEGWLSDDPICDWYGVSCGWLGQNGVVAIELPHNNLSGSLPSAIGDFEILQILDLNANHLEGPVPKELGGLQNLGELRLSENQLSGPVPAELASATALQQIWLHKNRLSGSIPPELGNMCCLWELFLSDNELGGTIPSALGNLRNLWSLALSNNRLGGEVPREIWELESLLNLAVDHNQLEGRFPEDIQFSSSFSWFLAEANQFADLLPRAVLALQDLTNLNLNYNAFRTDDPEILEFLTEHHEGDWSVTQTLAPDTVSLIEVDANTLRLEWFGGGPADLEGHTIVEHALSGGQWTSIGTTDSRDVSTFDLQRPGDSLSHHYRLRTVTDPHENNKNTVVSDPSRIVTFNRAGHIVVPALARLRGNGVDFTSTLDAFNHSETDLEMSLLFTPRSDVGGEPRNAIWTLQAGRAVTIEDALEYFFGPWDDQEAVGALIITVDQGRAEDLVLTGSIIARHSDGNRYGQAFPSLAFSESVWSGERVHIHTAVDPERSRVNVGLIALEPDTEARVRLVDPIGGPLGDGVHLFEGDAGVSTQLNDIWRTFGIDPVADALVEIDVIQGSLLAYGSILDGHGEYEGTSDPTTLIPFGDGREIVTLLEMGDIVGHDEFSGSASVSNTVDHAITVTAEFHQRGLPGVTAAAEFELGSGETRGMQNIVRDLFGLEDAVGTITLETNAAALVASGREFAIHRDDRGEIIGTSGQLIRGLTTEDLLWPEKSYSLIGLTQDVGAGNRRTNLAAFNPAGADVNLTLELFDQATGEAEGSIDILVRGQELVHLNAIIKAINPDHDETEKRLEITVSAPVYLQAFRVNASGDPVTLEAQLIAGR
jgi:hypothetical protein